MTRDFPEYPRRIFFRRIIGYLVIFCYYFNAENTVTAALGFNVHRLPRFNTVTNLTMRSKPYTSIISQFLYV